MSKVASLQAMVEMRGSLLGAAVAAILGGATVSLFGLPDSVWDKPLLVGSAAYLGLLFGEAIWSDVFVLQKRQAASLGYAVLLAISLGIATAVLWAGHGVLALSATDTGLSGLETRFGVAFAVSALATLLAGAVSMELARVEEYRGALRGEEEPYLTLQSPVHNIWQNVLQYWLIIYFITLPALLVIYSIDVPNSADTSFWGFVGFWGIYTGAVVTFTAWPLKNNFRHLQWLEAHRDEFCSFRETSDHVLRQCLMTGVFNGLMVGALWVHVFSGFRF